MRIHIGQEFFLRLGKDLYLNNPMRAGNSQLKLMLVHFVSQGPNLTVGSLQIQTAHPRRQKEKTVSLD